MKQSGVHSYLARDTGTSIVFWLVVAVGGLLVIDSVVHGDALRIAATASITALVLWTAGMVLFHPHLRYDESRIVVTNIGRIHDIPWSHVVTVRQNLSLTIELDDGRRITVSGVTAPRDRGLVLGTLTRGKLGVGSIEFHKTADAMRLLQNEAATNDSPVVSRWDVRALALGGALALAVAAVCIVAVL